MPGQNHQLNLNLWMIEGGYAAEGWGLPEAGNALLYLAEDRLYLVNSGMGSEMRTAIEQQLMTIGPVGHFTLLNTGSSAGVVGNNDVIHNVLADEKQHWMPVCEAVDGDAARVFADRLYEISRYYDPLHPLDGGSMRQFGLRLAREILAAFIGQRRALQRLASLAARRWPDLHPSLETAVMLPDDTVESLEVGDAVWQGWRLGEGEVWVLQAGAGLWCYLPGEKALFAPRWQDAFLLAEPGEKAQSQEELLEKLQSMLRSGAVQLLAGSTSSDVLQDREQALDRVEELKNRRHGLQQALEAVLKREPGMTIHRLYRRLRKLRHRPAVAWYLDAAPPAEITGFEEFLTGLLLEMGCTTRGIWRHKRFYLPEESGPLLPGI